MRVTLSVFGLLALIACKSADPDIVTSRRWPPVEVTRQERERAIAAVERHYWRTAGYVPRAKYVVTYDEVGPLTVYRIEVHTGPPGPPVFWVSQSGEILRVQPGG